MKVESKPGKLRKQQAFEGRDGELLDALADAMAKLDEQGIDIGVKMRAELSNRNAIKKPK